MADTDSVCGGRRSKSQLSVFDYPEHLNPFYEDENHKRLRFWKVGKKDGTSSRRGSFSLGGFRELWTFKSFRGKKKSSTLGVNKTSESPEPLRRYQQGNDSLYATYDPKHRNTYDNAQLNSNFQRNVPYRASLQDMNYAKNMSNSNGNGLGFNRNESYRSTIQVSGRRGENNNYSPVGYNTPTVPPRRYVYGGSVTPQPRTRYDHNSSSHGIISRGSSQYSIASSTNPFEDEDDNESTITSRLSGTESDRPTPTKRRIKKKRRAPPPPPVPIPKIIDEESSSIPTSPTQARTHAAASTRTPPTTPTDETSQDNNFENQLQHQMQMVADDISEQEKQEISNIAAEIEHYVKLLSQDDEDQSDIRLITASTPSTPKAALQKSRSSNSIGKSTPIQIKKSESAIFMSPTREASIRRKSGISMQKDAAQITSQTNKSRDTTSSERSVMFTKPFIPAPATSPLIRDCSPSDSEDSIFGKTQMKKLSNGFLPSSSYQIDTENNNSYDHRSASSKEQTPLNSSYDTTTTTTTTTTDESIPANIELKITESKEDISDQSNGSNNSDRYQIKYVPLKEGTPESPMPQRHEFKPTNNNNPSSSQLTELRDSSEPRKFSTERRRSVKEIIESINRSQSLLKVNQENQKSVTSTLINSSNSNNLNNSNNGGGASSKPTTPKAPVRNSVPRQRSEPTTKSPPSPSDKSSNLDESHRRQSQSEQEIRRMLVEMENLTDGREADAYCENVPSILDRFDEEVNNNDIFKKCILKKQWVREGSPTASNLDWNPVPKPKRSKNLSAELNGFGNNNTSGTNTND